MNTKHLPLDVIRNREVPWRTPGICPLAVSNKLKAIRELREPAQAERLSAEPRLAELLWFLQWRSHQPGGLDKFVKEFLLEFPEHLRTDEMAEIPRPRSGRYSLEECVKLWGALPKNKMTMWERLSEDSPRLAKQSAAEKLALVESSDCALLHCAKDIAYLLRGDTTELRKIDLATHRNAALLVEKLTPDFFFEECAKAAMGELPAYLSRLASDPSAGFGTDEVWFFDGILSALFEMMDRHAARERESIARTSVSEAIMDRFEFALEMRANVLMAGDARLGKSITCEAQCRMRPGRCRLVTVPSGNNTAEFIKAHAEPFYLSLPAGSSQKELAGAVSKLVKESGLFIAYDEFHFAIPDRAPKSASPPRLNWIRTHVVDAKRGVIFSTTRQAYGEALSKFLKHTQWAVEQWAGRLDVCESFGCDHDDPNAEPVLSRDDVLLIAAHKFPEIAPRVLEQIASEAYGTNAAPHVIESLLKAATWIARKAGRPQPSADDARRAITDWKVQARHESFEFGPGKAKGGRLAPAMPDPIPATPLPGAGRLAAVAPQSGRRVPADEQPAPVNRLSARTPTALVGG